MNTLHIALEITASSATRQGSAARDLRDRVLRELTGIDDPAGSIRRTPYGKPFLSSRPDLHWSSSSCDGAAGIAWCIGLPVGFDIEHTRDGFVDDDLLRSCLTPDERTAHEGLIRDDPSRFFRIWTRKEASLKCIGTGLHLLPDTIDAGYGSAIESEGWASVRVGSASCCFVRSLEPIGRIEMAVACEQPVKICLEAGPSVPTECQRS